MFSKKKNNDVDKEIQLIKAKSKTSLERSIRFIGIIGIPAVIILVGMIGLFSRFLTSEQLMPIVTLVSSAVVSIFAILQAIVNIKRTTEIKEKGLKEEEDDE